MSDINFNPRSSCEERQTLYQYVKQGVLFQSTLLMRGATSSASHAITRASISIHAPHARSDFIVSSLIIL